MVLRMFINFAIMQGINNVKSEMLSNIKENKSERMLERNVINEEMFLKRVFDILYNYPLMNKIMIVNEISFFCGP